MSRSKSTRRAWKRKERKRSGEPDPKKIQLHRQRVLDHIARRKKTTGGYKFLVLHCRLRFQPDSGETTFHVMDEEVHVFPFFVTQLIDCHSYVLSCIPEFNQTAEAEHLGEHVAKVRALHQSCKLMEREGDQKVCSAILDCPYRKWSEQHALPLCTL
ncbi:MAG: hypothetical protein WCV85_06080 [Patescibacteria group bacterium]